jgi:L-amino acid N-acyltransferase YncA
MTSEQLREKSRNSIVIVVYRRDELLGTACSTILKDKHGKNYSYEERIYVTPKCKRGGIGSKMHNKRILIAKENGCEYTISDTAEGALSSVKWHLKNGYKLVGLRSYYGTNYYSKIFRWQIEPNSVWNNDLFCKVHYWLSYLKCRMCYHEDASYKGPLKLYVKLRSRW